jgi:hypothetical protein
MRLHSMMLRSILAVMLVAMCAAPIPGQGIETNDLHAAIAALYREAGFVFPTISTPVSREELHEALLRLIGYGVPGSISGRAYAILDVLNQTSDQTVLSVGLAAAPEYYVGIDRSDFVRQLEVENPSVTLDLSFGRLEGAYLVANAVLRREWAYDDSRSNLPTPQSGNPLPFENNLMSAGYLFLPVGAAEITFGRQKVHLGPHPTDSLMVSDRVPFLDALKLVMTMGNLKMTSVTSTIENGRASPDVTLPSPSPTYDFDINTILYNIHYFEFVRPRFRFGIGSQVVIARKNNNFHLGDFFPVFTWHNADMIPNNLSLILDATVTPVAGCEIFAQVGFDDINASIFGIEDAGVPTIDAYIGGVTVSIPETPVTASLVAGYTHYLWGSFLDADSLSRALYRIEADGPRRSMPLTSPYGPGTVWLDFSTGISGSWYGALITYRAIGTNGASLYSTPYASSETLENAPRDWTHRLEAELSLGSPLLRLAVAPALVIEAGEMQFELEFSGVLGRRWIRDVAP